jgi:indole-3-glycerol phosphate synthase
MSTILDEILAHKREEVASRRRAVPLTVLRVRPLYDVARRPFRDALARVVAPAVIAELKAASPSRGPIRADYAPVPLARGYAAGGAQALSVLTDEHYFCGSLAHLEAVREAVTLPCLRKDFLVDPYQVEEARAAGADAVLVIAAAVQGSLGADLLAAADAAGLDALVEVHDEAELGWAVSAGATLIGVNNRSLATFTVRLETAEQLLPLLPKGVLGVAESGLRSAADLGRMVAAGAQAVLIGEAFMAAPDPGAALATLLAEWRRCP